MFIDVLGRNVYAFVLPFKDVGDDERLETAHLSKRSKGRVAANDIGEVECGALCDCLSSRKEQNISCVMIFAAQDIQSGSQCGTSRPRCQDRS